MVADGPTVKERARVNSLTDLVDGISTGLGFTSQTISQPWTLSLANNYTPLTLNRILLSYSFMTQGLVQTVVKMPVDDAFRGGFEIKSDELDEDEIKQLLNALKRPKRPNRKLARRLNPNAAVNLGHSDIRTIIETMYWSRLYGGAGLIINTTQDFSTELNIEDIKQDDPLEFIAADRWELILSQQDIYDQRNPRPFNYYGLPLHRTRVVKVLGVEAPSYIRLRLQGWGMSEIERCIRAINSFVKFENLIFELLDEAKVDVYKIQGFNDALLTDEGTANTQKRVQLANRLKNYQNALAMDAEDDWNQKQITWSGLAEIWDQLRTNLCSALKFPRNKLFGDSATGFGSGADSMENYNALVELVREDANPLVIEVVDLRCQQMFGFIPEYTICWKPLKLLDGVQEEAVKTAKQARAMDMFAQRLVTGREVSQILKAEDLLAIDTEVSKGLRDVEPQQPNAGDPSQMKDPNKPKPAAPVKK